MALSAKLSPAQDALRNVPAAQAPPQEPGNLSGLEAEPYTVKAGDFRLLVAPSLGLDWNDNVNLSGTSVAWM